MRNQSHLYGSVAAALSCSQRRLNPSGFRGCLFQWLLAGVIGLSVVSNIMAQAGRGGITGLVTDSSGALIPGATVQIVNEHTKVSQETVTSSAGLYFFSSIIPGTYQLTATYQGFQKLVQRPIHVEVDRVTEVNPVLKPGEVTQTVDVTAEAALANTTTSTIGQLITSKTLESVPLNGRDVYLLVQLSPGVVPVNGAVNQTGAFTRPGVGVSALKLNGQQSGSVAYMLDGSPLTVDGYGAGATSPALSPALEGVREYRVETNNLLPSYSSPGTGLISLASKSGGDLLHGSLFGFARPNALAANDPFLKASQLRSGRPNEPPDFRRYQWGGSIGGPIKKGKLFFFGDYESTFTRSLETLTATVPTVEERRGDFSQVPTIYNPFDVNAAGRRQPFANNIIPANLQNPVALNMVKLIPEPNQAGTGPYHLNNYFDGSLFPNDSQKFDVRLDSHFHAKHQIFGRYSFSRNLFGNADHYHNSADPVFYYSITKSQNILLADNYTLSPTTLLELRYSFTRHAENQPPQGQAADFDMTTLGFPASLAKQALVRSIPAISITGMYGVGSRTFATGFKFTSMNHNVQAGLSTVKGRHNLKTGFEYRKSFVNMGQPISPSGLYDFNTTPTSSTTFANDGYGFASFLLGMGSPTPTPNGFTLDPFVAQSSPYYASYVEDSIRMTTKLTLNVGLRWEVFGGRNERYDRQNYFDPTVQYAVNGVPLVGGSIFPKNGASPFTTNYKNFGPRFGLAYQPIDRLVVHGGFGIFFGPSPHSVAIAGTNSDSFSSRTTWKAVTLDQFGNSVMLNPLNNPFPEGLVAATQGQLGLATNLGTTLATVQRSQPDPSAYNWNFGLQYELPYGFLVSSAYVGSRGLHQIANINLNQLSLEQIAQFNSSLLDQVPNPYVAAITDPASPYYNRPTIPRWQALAPYPQFASGSPGGGVTLNTDALADSIYHSWQAKVEKRLSAHFSTLASFTFGKAIGTGVGPYAYIGSHGPLAQNWRNRQLDRAVDPQDVSRWFSWAAFYDLPIGPGRSVNTTSRWATAVLGGWTINSVLHLATGIPIVVAGSFPNQSLFFGQRPNLTCDPSQGAPRTSDRWFLPDCYAAPASPYVAGNAPRTLPNVRADGAGNLDASLFKNIKLSEGKNLQFRVEAFNLTNSVQLGLPNATWNPRDLSTFGRITSAASTPRQWQFALRFTF
jgi:hypothetical protein